MTDMAQEIREKDEKHTQVWCFHPFLLLRMGVNSSSRVLSLGARRVEQASQEHQQTGLHPTYHGYHEEPRSPKARNQQGIHLLHLLHLLHPLHLLHLLHHLTDVLVVETTLDSWRHPFGSKKYQRDLGDFAKKLRNHRRDDLPGLFPLGSAPIHQPH